MLAINVVLAPVAGVLHVGQLVAFCVVFYYAAVMGVEIRAGLGPSRRWWPMHDLRWRLELRAASGGRWQIVDPALAPRLTHRLSTP